MINPSFVLVTTALKETRALDSRNLFLGEWCLEFNEKSKYQDSILLNYHWSNFSKLESDYILIGEIYEKFLKIVGDKLNEIHGVSHSSRYWRIIIGPWLGYFIQGMFDKWQNLKEAFENYHISQTILIDFPIEEMIPNDMNSFIKLFSSDEWNHYCYNQILLSFESKFSFSKKTLPPFSLNKEINSKFSFKDQIIIYTKKILNIFSKKNDVLIASSYLGFKNELKLNYKLRQFPFFYNILKTEILRPDLKKRDSLVFNSTNFNEFEVFLSKQIFRNIPICFLEGFNNLVRDAKSNFYPQSPSIIYTSNITTYDVISMAYIAIHVENGAKLIHGQHGGYGIPRFMYLEDHEVKISDVFLSWGWTKNHNNVIPLGMPIPVDKYRRKDLGEGHLLMVRGLWPKYMFRIDSGSGLNLDNTIDDCLRFASLLDSEILKNYLRVRLYHSDYGFDEKLRWESQFPDINFGRQNCTIHELVSNSKLVVYTYNVSTGYLEFINANVPTIMFWNMLTSPVSEDAVEIFNDLKKVGMFHDNPESLSHHVNLIWDDVDKWWNSNEVLLARQNLCNKFAKMPLDIVSDLETIIKSL